MKEAFCKDDALLGNIRSADDSGDHFHLWWLGQSGFLIKWRSNFLLLDPYLSDSLTRKYSNSDKPHVRITERVINPERLDLINIATSSHNHTDHLDAETLQSLYKSNPSLKIVLPAANIEFAGKRLELPKLEMIGIDDKHPVNLDPFTFHGINAAHNDIERNELGQPKFMGFVVQFGPWSIYHSGDTLWHETLVSELLPHRIDLALLPINGNKPERRVAGNLSGIEAAALAKAIGARMTIGHHFDMFEFNTADPEEFITSCKRLSQNCRILQNGEGWCSAELEPDNSKTEH
ncbi:MAG: MBL fold metallo-hydrolase [Verrucomicrobiaceae bacterium]|nr:MBL fold metallo-hydrolase [Verrucomicrobiaceae bacterium]